MEQVTLKLESRDLETGEKLNIMIEGESNMPFCHEDLTFKAAIVLLQKIDEKKFIENDESNYEEYKKFVDKLDEVFSCIKNLYINDLY